MINPHRPSTKYKSVFFMPTTDKIYKNFFSRNYNFKILPEGLNKYFKVKYIVRKSNLNENHKLTLSNVKIASNIFQYIKFVLSTFKNKNSKYFLICISPYTFIAFLFLLIFRKKVFFISRNLFVIQYY